MNHPHQQTLSRMTTWALIAVFLIPLLASILMYFTRGYWELGTAEHGTLLSPPIDAQELLKTDQKALQWHILLIRSDCADAACELQLEKLKSIHEATGKDFNRVTTSLILRNETVDRLSLDDGIYIADPNGLMMLAYPLDGPAKDILDDLRHLLRNSQIG